MKTQMDLFITHAWRFHDEWTQMGQLLDQERDLSWRNFSVPWHDPAMAPHTGIGGKFVRRWLESQIIPVHAVIFLAGVYEIKSAQPWLKLELEFARKHGKPVIGVPPMGREDFDESVSVFCDRMVRWDSKEIIRVIDELIQTRSLSE